MDLDRSLNRESGFTYPSIDPSTQIRLLRPSPNSTPEHLQFNFEIVPLEKLSDTRYKALSYTWGRISTAADLHTVQINNQPFLIRPNLFDFLTTPPGSFDDSEELISLDDDGDKPLLFIDALCINQFNTTERQAQVQLMTHIYRRASAVIAWLGLPPPSQRSNIFALAAAPTLSASTSWTPSQASAHRYLSFHPYWSRVWVLQELLLASRVTIRCGTSAFPLRLFATPGTNQHLLPLHRQSPAECATTHRLRALLRPAPSTHDPLHEGTTVLPLDQMLLVLKDTSYTPFQIEEYQSQIPDDLHEVLTKYGHLECSDTRDKLYGFLGLLNERARSQIRADYERGVGFAFYQALRVGLMELAREVVADLAGREHEHEYPGYGRGVDRGWVERFYQTAKGVFGMEEKEGREVLERVVRELRIGEWLGEVEFAVLAQQDGGWRVGGIVTLEEFQRVNKGGEGMEKGQGRWLERLHSRQLSAAKKVGLEFGRARVRLLRV